MRTEESPYRYHRKCRPPPQPALPRSPRQSISTPSPNSTVASLHSATSQQRSPLAPAPSSSVKTERENLLFSASSPVSSAPLAAASPSSRNLRTSSAAAWPI